MKKLMILFLSIVFASTSIIAQTPQNITQGDGKGESLWNSTSAIIFAVVLILLLIIGRTWSKKVHEKRDEMSRKDKEDE